MGDDFDLVTRTGASIELQSQRRLPRRPYGEKSGGGGGCGLRLNLYEFCFVFRL